MSQLIKTLSIILVFVTATGVFLHDMKIDTASKYALALPAMIGSGALLGASVAKMDHIHVERASSPRQANVYHSSPPRVFPPRDDDRRHLHNKKGIVVAGGSDQNALWPSV